MVCNIPDAQCMAYLPTFAINVMVNVGKYTIHWASGIWLNILSHLLSPSPSKCRERPFPIRSTRPIVVVQGDSGIRRKGGKKLSWDLPPQNNDVSVRFEKSFKYLMSCLFFYLLVVDHRWPGAMIQSPFTTHRCCLRRFGVIFAGCAGAALPVRERRKKRKKTSRSSGTNPGVKGCHSISAVRWPPWKSQTIKNYSPQFGMIKIPY